LKQVALEAGAVANIGSSSNPNQHNQVNQVKYLTLDTLGLIILSSFPSPKCVTSLMNAPNDLSKRVKRGKSGARRIKFSKNPCQIA